LTEGVTGLKNKGFGLKFVILQEKRVGHQLLLASAQRKGGRRFSEALLLDGGEEGNRGAKQREERERV
jgi:hypothetical protein